MSLKNAFNAVSSSKRTTKGNAGYDNARENIDPQVKTQALSTKEIVTNAIKILTDGKITFRDNAIFIHSNADGQMTIEADSQVIIGVAGDIELGDSTERDMLPNTTLKINLGTASNLFNDAYIGGSTVILSNLPGADPTVAGQLWNDAGTLKVSAG